ncbi:phosphoenolpyruvate carboxylase [Candidatus Solincola sp.]|nr:phosphoenolpyruvate carboxylase [Actinomycetota bacterium]MDI7251927.1 phosphoenolpyruvate carboxylase [Actinomycetota bacterium]
MSIPIRKVPRCMSTQHPDNVQAPFFATDTVLGGDDEIQEAFYVFSHLGCDEQMWDCEGKEVDNFVVKKLLTRYESFFRETVLGRDVFLTLRVPNPTVEKAEAKILLETLESIPRSFDAACLFYGEEIPPIFEVILPMTASTRCIDRIYRYYSDFVVGKQDRPFQEGDITIAEWIGEFKPRRINVIPLFEDWEHMLESASMVREYLRDKEVEYQRVFLARSDPAMNYGMISAVLLNKLALVRLEDLSRELGVPILPIIGVGSAPFRGNLTPRNVEGVIREYPSAHTFTVQSSFKFDHPPELVIDAVRRLRDREDAPPHRLDEGRCLELAERYTAAYQAQVTHLAPVINRMARFVPSRRKRKLHIGLFGYSRSMGKVSLPRAITFTAALYSLGLPPELLGLDALRPSDWEFLKGAYLNLERDLADALRYFNPRALDLLPEDAARALRRLDILSAVERDPDHQEVTDLVLESSGRENEREMREAVLRAAGIRRFLG